MIIKTIQSGLKRFKNDIKGNFGAMASLTVLGLMSGIGLSVDAQRFYQHAEKAQSVADAAGLSAAVFASNNNGMAPDDFMPGVFVEGQTYSAADVGFTLAKNETIDFTVDYDQLNGEVTVSTVSSMSPIILHLLGKSSIGTEKSSTVKFDEPGDKNAASVLYVLDNSGSMWFDDLPEDIATGLSPANAVKRIDALKTNVNRLNNQFRAIDADTQPTGSRFLRSGLIAYNNGTNGGLVPEEGPGGAVKSEISMEWGTIPAGSAAALSPVGTPTTTVNGMFPFGGTNSGPALQRALEIMVTDSTNEKTEHADEGNEDPSRFVVFMSDGQNDNDAPIWIADDTTGLFRRLVWRLRCTERWPNGWCRTIGWVQEFVEWDVNTDGVIEGREEPAGSGWEEGVYVSSEDQITRQNCDALKADGVIIYTIGFALEAGEFRTNDWSQGSVPGGGTQVTAETLPDRLTRAVSLMQDCATNPNTFLLASNATQLDIAFRQIGDAILSDIIRLTN